MPVINRSWRVALVGSLAVGITISLAGIGQAGTPAGVVRGAAARQTVRNAYLRGHAASAASARGLAAATAPTNTAAPTLICPAGL